MHHEGVSHLLQPELGIEAWATVKRGATEGVSNSRRNIQEVTVALFLLRQCLLQIRHHDTDQATDIDMNRFNSLHDVLPSLVNILTNKFDILADAAK